MFIVAGEYIWSAIRPGTYLFHICAQGFLAEHVEALLNPGQGHAGVNVRARRHPDRVETRVLQHLVVGAVDLDARVLVLLSGPGEFMRFGATHGDHVGAVHSIDQCIYMTLAHAAEASNGDVDAVCWHGIYSCFQERRRIQ